MTEAEQIAALRYAAREMEKESYNPIAEREKRNATPAL